MNSHCSWENNHIANKQKDFVSFKIKRCSSDIYRAMMYGVNIIWLAGIMNRFFSLSFHSNSKLEFSSLMQKSKTTFLFHYQSRLLTFTSIKCCWNQWSVKEGEARGARNLFRFCQSTIVNYSHSAPFDAIVLTKTKSLRRWKIFIFIIVFRFIAFDFRLFPFPVRWNVFR